MNRVRTNRKVFLVTTIILFVIIGISISDSNESKAKSNSAPGPDGKAIYAAKCAGCHGANANGKNAAPKIRGLDENMIKSAVTNGIKGKMPSFKLSLGDDGIGAVAAYVQSLD